MDAFKMYMAGVMTSFVVAATLLGYIATQEKVACPPDTYTCPWAAETLTLEGWRGKVSRRTYTFKEPTSGLLYQDVARDAYNACTRHAGEDLLTPEEQAHREEMDSLTGWALLFGVLAFFGAAAAPLVRTEIRDWEYAKAEREREARDSIYRAEQQASWERQCAERRKREAERAEELKVERARSKAAHEERLERKRVKREALEARTLANAERRKK